MNGLYVTDAFEIVEHILLSRIIDIDERSTDYDATTPLFWAIKENHCRMVEILLDFGSSDVSLNVYCGHCCIYRSLLSPSKCTKTAC